MAPSSRDRISVDLRGLKAALLAQSAAKKLTPSDFVRTVLAEALDQGSVSRPLVGNPSVDPSDGRVRVSLRLSAQMPSASRLRPEQRACPWVPTSPAWQPESLS